MMESTDSSQNTQQVIDSDTENTPINSGDITVTNPVDVSASADRQKSSSSRQILPKIVIGVILGAGAIASGIYYYRWSQFSQSHLTTDVAYTNADTYPVTSRVAGIVTEVTVKDNEEVNPGKLLIKLDPREVQASVAQAKAALDVAKQQAEVARENINNVPTTIISEPLSPVPGEQPKLVLPKVTQSINKQIEVNRQQYKAALATVTQRQAELKQAELQLSYANINAVTSGQIGNVNVRAGQQVQPGQTLLEIVQPNPWVVANFQENQLEKLQPGQTAEIKIAAFPSRKFVGKVERVSPSPVNSVAVPSPSNTYSASNYTSAVRRIPVKIVFEPDSIQGFESRIAPGMSANVTINTK
ncbi:HlyD family secretion protein [Calothrix sp. UHCC 0171]|uniref:HlyD family secretion protein n=1 Tax=Calothrix sp. UHCC 0171 TaxID=3110245 RepID=UPI002B214DC7|nr:HlyD family secretion protein [Calothrix sp. UHCC 0171]MEA5573592.1 HlyD family secretion protein [Calothrix sp. UHCC 0171]